MLSAGSWGTAFAAVLADAGNNVVVHGRRAEIVEAINTRRENPAYLPGIALPRGLKATGDVALAVKGAECVVVPIPAQALRASLTAWAPLIGQQTVVASLMKGIETDTGLRMSEVITEVTGLSKERVAVISGPNLAREVANRRPATSVVACPDHSVAETLQQACATGYFRPYTTVDVIGCELGGAVKNVIALAVGLTAGLGLGDNSRALLMTRGLAEVTRLGVALGADPLTFTGLAGAGDLLATCASGLSRNRTFGEHLGRGMSVAEATIATRQTAEGVASSQAILGLARRHSVEMPVTEAVVDIIQGGLTAAEAVKRLMNRAVTSEHIGSGTSRLP
ncbi:NAD(P)H-dependent glycerol-3-phosphate dehydrogenase [Streptomyces sp. NPDC047072]|uniref:NAD(P)H-dependent glycerol-3-phosphate dehydrogenase n=1 Tax=Streptomyces sp. NPDC047072 TaxID=3154809 RepID=UPI0033ECB6D8